MHITSSNFLRFVAGAVFLFSLAPINSWSVPESRVLNHAREYTQQVWPVKEITQFQDIPCSVAIPQYNKRRINLEIQSFEQRLERIERSIEHYDRIGSRIEEESYRVEDKLNNQISLLACGFGALGALAAIAGVAGVFVTILTSKTAIQSIKIHKYELEEIVKEARKHKQTLLEMMSRHSPSEKFPERILARAKESIKTGAGSDVLWGHAVLAQEEGIWLDALIYWEGILKLFPKDKNALFGASLALLQLAAAAKGEEQYEYLMRADKYFVILSSGQMTSDILNNWGKLYEMLALASSNCSEYEYYCAQAYDKYIEAIKLDNGYVILYVNLGNLCMVRGDRCSDLEKRKKWYKRAIKNYDEAICIDSHDANIWKNYGVLCQNFADVATDTKEKHRWFKRAQDKFEKAINIDPTNSDAWYNFALLYCDIGENCSDSDERTRMFREAAKRFKKVININPRDEPCWYDMARLEALMGNTTSCVKYLEKWYALGGGVSACTLGEQKDFALIRNTAVFKNFIIKLRREELRQRRWKDHHRRGSGVVINNEIK